MPGCMESVWRSRPWRRSAPYESYERTGQRPLGLQLPSWLRVLDLSWSATCKPATRQGGSWMVGFHANAAVVFCSLENRSRDILGVNIPFIYPHLAECDTLAQIHQDSQLKLCWSCYT
ncbi:hypothetical protein BN1723_000247 [Verticillium longisporum]|uniref:Uncharacterized protein n=1 Tax=Verticillium longisporum TaxID=100787 RepID=A0A0G4KEN4_VERLO|nr:hypothetical protein BN1723_000247 [Verticillium longisporum]CRK34979.1 hypothetical protein BN1708_006605 [Verticillium longisporum]